MKHSVLKSAIFAVAALGTASANAELITEWTYSVDTTIIGANFTSGGGTQVVSDYELSWGATGGSFDADPKNRSAITLDLTDASGNVMTNGAFVPSGEITHWNNSISNTFATLTDASISSTLTLTQFNPVGGEMVELTTTFMVEFTETYNEDDINNCIAGSVSRCDDIFVIDAASLVDQFIVDGYIYTVVIQPEGFGPLSNAQCAAAGAAAGCTGFTTLENTQNDASLSFAIFARPVSEPGTLAVIGLGLLGFGALRRKS